MKNYNKVHKHGLLLGVFKAQWQDIDDALLMTYIEILIFAGLYKSHESVGSMWSETTGRSIFRNTMSLKHFFMLSRVIRSDSKETRSQRRSHDKVFAIRDLWDKWLENQSIVCKPS